MNNLSAQTVQKRFEEKQTIDLKKVFSNLTDKWLWIFLSVFVSLFFAFLYIKYTAPTYQINARLLVNDDEKGGGLGKQAGAMMDLGGLLGSKNSVDNEAEILKTQFLMEQVVRQMQLNIVYLKRSNFTDREMYQAPFKLNIIKGVDTIKETRIDIEKLAGTSC